MASKALACSASSFVMPTKASLSSASLVPGPRSVLFRSTPKTSSSASKRSLVVRAQQYGAEPYGTRAQPQQYGGQQLGTSNPSVVHTPWHTTEDEKEIKMRIDMPGMLPEDLNVKVEGNTLVIKDLGRQIFSPYNTTIELPPDCVKEQVQAVLKNGVLHVSVPKRFPPTIVHIPVRTSY